MSRVADLLGCIRALLPYAESRAEDLSEAKERGEEDPDYPGADEAWEVIREARVLVGEA